MRYSTGYGSRDLGSGAIGSGYPPSLQQYRLQAGIHDCQLRSNVRRVGFLCVLWLFALLDFQGLQLRVTKGTDQVTLQGRETLERDGKVDESWYWSTYPIERQISISITLYAQVQ